ncbi:MAG: regulatory protein RecX [Bacteroidales bacterium]
MFVLKKAIFANIKGFMETDSRHSFILKKISKYCAQRERAEKEVREKLIALGSETNEISEIISILKNENLINEERFASAFVHDKFVNSGWGKHKILYALDFLEIPTEIKNKALDSIPLDDYVNTAIRHIKNTKKTNNVVTVMINKGFEEDLIIDLMNKHCNL